MPADLGLALYELVAEHGLDRVYETLREGWQDEFCGNCGTPILAADAHIPDSFGRCLIRRTGS
jgi:hypothetical protein